MTTQPIRREISLTHLIAISIPIFIAILGGWITIQQNLASYRAELDMLKSQRQSDKQELREEIKEMKTDLKEIKTLLLQDALNKNNKQ